MEIPDKKLEELLRESGLVTPEQVREAQARQQESGGSLQTALIGAEILDEDSIVSLALAQGNVSSIRLKNYPVTPEAMRLIPRDKCIAFSAIPVALDGELLTVAMDDPFNVVQLDDLHLLTKKDILPVYAKRDEIRRTIDKHYPHDRMTMTDVVERIDTMYAGAPPPEPGAEEAGKGEEANEQSPVIVLLGNKIIEDAFHQGASDIHVEHQEERTVIRYRIDGHLRESLVLPPKTRQSLVARLKIMANMDISEKRLPQDGRIVFKNFSRNRLDIDIRISTMPTTWGEKIVMRLLDRQKEGTTLDGMGFLPDTLEQYRRMIQRPWGMILHVGPTGSGKTTTLQAALRELNTPDTNIQTAEDPVEYMIPGVNQVQMHPEIGLNFARALRGFLRQDPDVIMVGEIRDLETAKIATEAALTGHVLFSTLHTNDAVQTVTRLKEMGVEPFLLSATLLGICAQRLARRLCVCKKRYDPTPEERKLLGAAGEGVASLFKARGCGVCHNVGYKGRIGIHELLVLNDEVRQAINLGKPALELKKLAIASGMRTLYDDAVRKAIDGVTSLDEVLQTVSID